MRKFIFVTVICAFFALFCGCEKKIDYYDYVSEKRTDIYVYSDDVLEIKIHTGEKENPYCIDGIKGEMRTFCEIYVKPDKYYEKVYITAANAQGEMNYRAVEKDYYLSLSSLGTESDSVAVNLELDGEKFEYTAQSVRYKGLISMQDALSCVMDYDENLFKSLSGNGIFDGEIYIRLLYDEGCFYYVGVCGKDKRVNAFLVDGERGKVIANRQTDA